MRTIKSKSNRWERARICLILTCLLASEKRPARVLPTQGSYISIWFYLFPCFQNWLSCLPLWWHCATQPVCAAKISTIGTWAVMDAKKQCSPSMVHSGHAACHKLSANALFDTGQDSVARTLSPFQRAFQFNSCIVPLWRPACVQTPENAALVRRGGHWLKPAPSPSIHGACESCD